MNCNEQELSRLILPYSMIENLRTKCIVAFQITMNVKMPSLATVLKFATTFLVATTVRATEDTHLILTTGRVMVSVPNVKFNATVVRRSYERQIECRYKKDCKSYQRRHGNHHSRPNSNDREG
jgi:hypothetical protein